MSLLLHLPSSFSNRPGMPLELCHNMQAKAYLLAVLCFKSGAWLITHLIPSLGLQMDDDVKRIVAGLHMGNSTVTVIIVLAEVQMWSARKHTV